MRGPFPVGQNSCLIVVDARCGLMRMSCVELHASARSVHPLLAAAPQQSAQVLAMGGMA